MSAALGIMGILAILIAGVMLVVSAIRKKRLRIWGIIAGVGLVLFITGIALPSPITTPPPPPAETTELVSPPTTPEKPALTTAEQAYANAVGDQAMSVSKALTQFGELIQNPQNGDDPWTLQVATQLVIIQTVYDQAMELDPPSSMAEIHLKYTQGMKAYNDMTYLFSRGVDELDLNLIDQAVTKMETGIRLINEATELMREFTEAHK